MTPKSLLRHKLAVSKLADFAESTHFKSIIEDDIRDFNKIEKLIFCSGKVYYDLFEERERLNENKVALIRLEELYPYPKKEIIQQFGKYRNIRQIIWCQEEHKNMGAWQYIKPKFEEVLKEIGNKLEVKYVGRDESASPAAGYTKLHLEELNKFLKKAFE
jgi:2-oxoglutarate dehydrogenase E1 component